MFFKKNNTWEQVCNQNLFRAGGWGFVELGHVINISSRTQEKEAQQGNILEIFVLDTFKTTFWMENLTKRWTQSGPFFPKSGNISWFQKGHPRLPLSPLVARLWVWLNMHQYPWICLNIVKNPWINCSGYTRVLNIHDHLTCPTGFWRCLDFQISQGSEYGVVV